MKSCLFFIIYCLLPFVYCILPIQSFSQKAKTAGKLEIVQDSRIPVLIDKHKTLNLNIKGIQGYRVQIYSESGPNSKNKANNVKNDFQKKFPDISIYILFQEPNYKVRFGDFRNQLDALGYLHKAQPTFPNAFIVADKINLPKL